MARISRKYLQMNGSSIFFLMRILNYLLYFTPHTPFFGRMMNIVSSFVSELIAACVWEGKEDGMCS